MIGLLFFSGFFLGMFHAFEPDHLATISTFVSSPHGSKKSGLFWGIGHSISLLIATLLVIILRVSIPSSFFEILVGMVLIVLGLRLLLKKKLGNHKHQLAIGMLHGLAGTASVIIILITENITILQSIIFVIIFGLGSLVGMYIVSISLTSFLKKNSVLFTKKVSLIIGIISILIGLYKLIYFIF